MDESVLVVIILITVILPCAVSYGLVRFKPKLRYLPSILLLIVGFFFMVSALNTEPTGGGISGFGDMGIIAAMLLGGVFLLAAGVVFMISWMLYIWRGKQRRLSGTDERPPARPRGG